jgi:hypothetical protein
LFLNDQSGTPNIASDLTGMQNQTWFTLKLTYQNTGVYTAYINDVLQGSLTTTRETQKYLAINQVLIMSSDTVSKIRNVYVYDGI